MRRWLAIPIVLVLLAGAGGRLSADARSNYLIRLLQTSSAFRVRTQAALSLGRVPPTTQVVVALGGALDDEHPAVRTAAAASLEILGDPSALPALRAAENDSEPRVRDAIGRTLRSLERVARTRASATASPTPVPIPTSPPRFYVGVGMPGTRVARIDAAALAGARTFISTRLQQMDGVVLAPIEESPSDARRVLDSRRLTGYFIDSSIVRLERSADGSTRAVVSVIVGTYPGRDLRAVLEGRATVTGGSDSAGNSRQALEGALSGALRGVPQVMTAVAGQGG